MHDPIAGIAYAWHYRADQRRRLNVIVDGISGAKCSPDKHRLIENNFLRRVISRRIEVREQVVLFPKRRHEIDSESVVQSQLRSDLPGVLTVKLEVVVWRLGQHGLAELPVLTEVPEQGIRECPLCIAGIQRVPVEENVGIVRPERILLFDGVFVKESRLERVRRENLGQVVGEVRDWIGVRVRRACESCQLRLKTRAADTAEAEIGDESARVGRGVEQRNIDLRNRSVVWTAARRTISRDAVPGPAILKLVRHRRADNCRYAAGDGPAIRRRIKWGKPKTIARVGPAVGTVLRLMTPNDADESLPSVADVVVSAIHLVERWIFIGGLRFIVVLRISRHIRHRQPVQDRWTVRAEAVARNDVARETRRLICCSAVTRLQRILDEHWNAGAVAGLGKVALPLQQCWNRDSHRSGGGNSGPSPFMRHEKEQFALVGVEFSRNINRAADVIAGLHFSINLARNP